MPDQKPTLDYGRPEPVEWKFWLGLMVFPLIILLIELLALLAIY